MAGGKNNNRTAYGTSSLASDPTLSGRNNNRRRSLFKIGAITVTGGAVVAAVGYWYWGHSPSDTLSSSAGASTYINGETKMMEPIKDLKWKKRSPSSSSSSFIRVDSSKMYQEIMGFGGAFTEASAIQFAKLSKEKQEEVLTLYFDKENGSGYEFGRIPMGSCDFSPSSYNFADVANDTSLEHFDMNVTHDTELLIPFVQRALEKNPELKLFLSPWSPPGWMKMPNSDGERTMISSPRPEGLDPEYQEAWALYFSKFITAYKHHGIPFWGLTVQNEPEAASPWEACIYTPSSQSTFLGGFLGPVIKRDHPDVKIMIFDFIRGSMLTWAETIYNDPDASKYADGMAMHWYGGGVSVPRYADGMEYHEKLNDTHYVDPNRFILATEAANCPGIATGDEAWFRGQRYAHDIIADFNNWVVGWVDWNLILDHTGGPNHLGNVCDAPIVIDETEEDYFLQPMYYFIQHFSKYVPVGSRRIQSDIAIKFKSPGDAQLHPAYPLELHTCDNSSRQQLELKSDGKLEVSGTGYCFDVVEPNLIDMITSVLPSHQLVLSPCEEMTLSWSFEDDKLQSGDYCLGLNHGSTADGVRVNTEVCEDIDSQKWTFKDGLIQSVLSSTQCVTAGYSFVQANAFVTPDNKKVFVVMNENTVDADFELQYGDLTLEATIPRGAIQTYTWEY